MVHPSPEGDDDESWRLSAYDLRQGERVGVRMTSTERHCLPARPGKLWCTHAGGLALRSVPSLALLRSPAALVAEVPALAAGFRPRGPFGVDVATGEAFVPTADGQEYVLDPDLLAARPVGRGAPRTTRLSAERGGVPRFERAPASVEMAGARYVFQAASGEQRHLFVDDSPEPRAVYRAPMLAPAFLPDGGGGGLVAEGRVFWTYDTSLDPRRARRVLVAWGPAAEPWQREGSRAPVQGLHVENDRLFLVWGPPRVELEALDIATGRRLWVRHL